MINDPNYQLPKDAFIRLFDNPIPAGDPARSEAPDWAQELDEVVVWAHMGENGEVSVKVNGEDIGGGGGGEDGEPTTATITLSPDSTGDFPSPDNIYINYILYKEIPEFQNQKFYIRAQNANISENAITDYVVPQIFPLTTDTEYTPYIGSITGDYEEIEDGEGYKVMIIRGDVTMTIVGGVG